MTSPLWIVDNVLCYHTNIFKHYSTPTRRNILLLCFVLLFCFLFLRWVFITTEWTIFFSFNNSRTDFCQMDQHWIQSHTRESVYQIDVDKMVQLMQLSNKSLRSFPSKQYKSRGTVWPGQLVKFDRTVGNYATHIAVTCAAWCHCGNCKSGKRRSGRLCTLRMAVHVWAMLIYI